MSEIKSISIRFLILFCILRDSLGQRCGRGNGTSPSRIVGGQNAGRLEWPWMAKLIIEFSSFPLISAVGCDGSLISDRWIVTAAHCVTPPEGYRLSIIDVTLGEHDTNRFEWTEVKRWTSEFYTNGYNADTIENDIALIKFFPPLDFNFWQRYLQPICLPSDDSNIDGDRCVATGWGATSADNPNSQATILQEARLPILDNDYCNSTIGQVAPFQPQTKLCAGYEEGGISVCYGDSGGPLNCPQTSNGLWVLTGITSYGAGCARPGYPAVFTRVSAYFPWIREVTSISN